MEAADQVVVPGPGAHVPLWSERLDVGRHRDFRPLVSVPRNGDRQISRIADMADRALTQPLTGLFLSSSAQTVRKGIEDRDRLLRQWGFYADDRFLADPSTFFEPPPAGIVPVRKTVERTAFRPVDGEVVDLFFASPFEPVNPSQRKRYLRYFDNRIAHARYWHHDGGPRPTAVLIHGYVGANPAVNAVLFNTRWLYTRGMNVMLFKLPFHGERRTVLDGYAFPNLDLARMAEAFAHAVYDFRIYLEWLTQIERSPAVGALGVSLGGYTAALLAELESRLAFAVPIIPATSIVDVAFDWAPGNLVLQGLLRFMGLTIDDMRRFAAVHTPLQHPLAIPKDRTLIIGADADRVTPSYQARLLWENWDGPDIHWFAGSHIVHVHRGTYLRRLGRFLASCGVFGD